MPVEPETKTEGPFTYYVAETTFPNRAYVAGCIDVALDPNDPRSMSQKLDDARSGAVSNTGGTFIEERDIEINGHPGREFSFSLPAHLTKGVPGGQTVMRAYLVGSRIYLISALGFGMKSSDSDVVHFFNSFELTSAPPPPVAADVPAGGSPASPVASATPAVPSGPPPIPEAFKIGKRIPLEQAQASPLSPGPTTAQPAAPAPAVDPHPTAASSAMRTWTDRTGKRQIEGELVEVRGTTVRIKRRDGKVVPMPMHRLSDADQEFVRSQQRS